ncbi:MAG: FG-GAP repeat domain-containing protein, partial [Verrucomicrobiota bacterium]
MKDSLPPFPPTRPPAGAPTRPGWSGRLTWARPLAGAFALALALALAPGAAGQEPQVIERDLDRDGVAERLVSRPGRTEIEIRDPATGEWKPAGFGLPEGVSVLDAGGTDAGLRWVDLNGDGFDDVVFSNDQAYGIHLWTKNVQPHLGWTRGWSQFVRAGRRAGAAGEPPPLAGSAVTLEDGQVVIRHPAREGRPERVERVAAREWIDYRMPPPRSPEAALASFRVRPGFRVELAA